VTYDSLIRPPSGRMSPAAMALAVALHALVAAALGWASPLRPHDHAETPIMVTVEPQPLSGGGAPATGSAAPTSEPATAEAQPPTEPVRETAQQAMAPAEPTPSQPQPQMTEPSPAQPIETQAEALWQTEASAWKPQVTFEETLPPPQAPPPPTSRDIPKPQRPPPATRPVQRAQTAFPPRPAQPPAPRPPGDQQAAASIPGPSSSSMDASSGHGGQRNDYLSRVFRHIEPFRNYPAAARENRQQGRVVSRVTINRSGQVVGITVDRSSGWPIIDAAEVAAIRRASPLPPVPSEMPGDPIVLVLPMNYGIR